MTAEDEQNHREIRIAPTSIVARYLFALVATGAGLAVTLAIFESDVGSQPIYAPLIGAVALSTWFGGLGPGALSVVVSWSAALWVLVAPGRELLFGDTEDMTRWSVNLAVAVVIAGMSGLLRTRQARAAGELVATRESIGEIESLQQLSVALSAALSSSDVARVLTAHAGDIVGAQGVAVGLADGDHLVVVDLSGIAARAGVRGLRIALHEQTLLTAAAREEAVARAEDRSTLQETYPEGRRFRQQRVHSAFAVPIRVADRAVGGSVAFLFDHEGGPTTESEGLARIVAGLAGQALERARLYEQERESRRALDRILQVAPRFLVDDAGTVVQSVCREARATFGADYGVLWRVVDDRLELLCVDPPRAEPTADLHLRLDDFPRLHNAIRGLRTSFVPDVLETTKGDGLNFVRNLGIRSSLRAPVVIAGQAELVLSISWQVVVSEPDPATLAVVRRFADQAGLALEQLERRRAEGQALARAEGTRRLQQVTAALSQAATPLDVSNTCLAHALESIGAEAGFVVLTGPDGTRTVDLVASSGYDDDELEAWRGFGLDDDLPFGRAIGTGEPVWALGPEEMSALTGFAESRTTGWFAIPLMTSRGARGALHVSLRDSREITESEREWLQAMVAQCGQALERSGLYEEEQRSRMRAERLQTMTAQLSNALSSADVADVVVDEIAAAYDPTALALVAIADGHVTRVLRSCGDGENVLAPLLDLAEGTPGGLATRSRRSVLIDDRQATTKTFPATADAMAALGHETLLVVPFVAARLVNGLLVASWEYVTGLVAEDRAVVEALAGQAAQALDRAGRYESEQAIAETLQRSVLPDSLPRVEGVQLAARYLPGSAQLDVGGDWFDAMQLPDGKLGLVVGDVVGKGVQAAASMAQLRNAIRAFSVERLKPSSALARLNRLSQDVLDTSFATLVYVALEPSTGVCRMSSAGHPPPVVAFADGRVELLETARGLPLGTGLQAKYRQATVELPAGSMLVLYTDGLVERRGRSIDEGFAALCAAVETAPRDPDRLLDHVLEQVIGERDREDDIALLAARLLPVAPRTLELRVSSSSDSMPLVRDAMRTWLAGTPLDRADAEGVVLATWEAFANAVEHAANPTEAVVRVRAELDDARIRVVVEDTGGWVPPSDREDRGFGLRLIERLVSSVDIARSEAGTTITLEKALGTEHASAG
ncbi:MAG TPA: SpoIIE family protein phosphatase [Gaiellaceae bacterium]|nr:SpoIIE family protein phosphatase [Gaiellaceae bacterium]